MPGARKPILTAGNAPSGVKDAFAAWLTELEGDDAPEKVLAALQPRRRQLSRAERSALIEHAQQSTTTSAQKRSTVAEAVDASNDLCRQSSSRLPPIASAIEKQASAQRRHQALVDQASYSALNNSYTPDLSPGLGFFVRLTDAVIAGNVGRLASTSTKQNVAPTSGNAKVREYELRNFPIRIVPTLLRVRPHAYRSPQSNQRTWFMALLASRHMNDDDEESVASSELRANSSSTNSLPSGKFSSKTIPASAWILHIRIYMLSSQPKQSGSDALPSDGRREVVRTLLSSWVSISSGGHFGGGIRAVYKRKSLPSLNEAFNASGTTLCLLRSIEEVEKAVDTLCNEFFDRDKWGFKHPVGDNVNSLDNNAEHSNDVQPTDVVEAIQPYIPSRSSLHSGTNNKAFAAERSAWIARCSFRKKEKNSSTIWILSGGGEVGTSSSANEPAVAMTVDEKSDICQIVKCTSSQAWTEPRLLTTALALDLERILKMSFKEIVVDMIQGSDGGWWIVQVKAFEIRQQEGPPRHHDDPGSRRTKSAPERLGSSITNFAQKYRKWRCAGRYCAIVQGETSSDILILPKEDSATEPCGYLSLKVVRSCEFVDDYYCRRNVSLGGGFESFSTSLAFHLQHELPRKETRQLYEPQSLCSSCMRRYYQLREQLDQTLSGESNMESTLSRSKRSSMPKLARQTASTGKLQPAKPRFLPTLPSASELSFDSGISCGDGSGLIYPSVSAPDLFPRAREIQQTHCDSNDSKASSMCNYVEQLAEMDKFLDLPTTIAGTQKDRADPLNKDPVEDVYARIFSPSDQQRRVDAIWQSVAPKSLPFDTKQERTKQPYNRFSVADELRQVRDEQANDCTPFAEGKSNRITVCVNRSDPSVNRSKKAHQIRLSDCRELFSDDAFKDRLVKEAVDAICERGEKVCFVVMPGPSGADDDGLPDIGLRSLLLDVKDTLGASGYVLGQAPQIVHEASGCITMTVE